METLREYLKFRKFIMPQALQLLFWAGIGGVLYGSWWLFSHDNRLWIVSLVFGSLVTRLIFESLVLRYQTYVCLLEIKEGLDDK